MYGVPYPARSPTAPHAVLSDVLQRFPPALPRRSRSSRARAPQPSMSLKPAHHVPAAAGGEAPHEGRRRVGGGRGHDLVERLRLQLVLVDGLRGGRRGRRGRGRVVEERLGRLALRHHGRSLLRVRVAVPADCLVAERPVLLLRGVVEGVERGRRCHVARRPVLLQLHRVRQAERVSDQRVQLLGLVE